MDTREWHPQDWLVVVEALVSWSGPDPNSPREERAWELAADIAEEQGLALEEYMFQVNHRWPN